MKKLTLLFCAVFLTGNIFAESVYAPNLAKDLIIGSVSLGLTGSSFFIHHAADSVSATTVPKKRRVNAFDRGSMFEYNKPLDIVSDVAVYGLAVLPVASLAGNFTDGKAWLSYGIMYAESLLLVFGTTEIMKNSIPRYRPYRYFGDIPSGKDDDYYKSFPSRHTAIAFASAGFFTTTFFAEHPESPLKIPLAAAAYTFAAGIGASRVASGNHFISDTLAGAAIGTIYGYLVPWLHLQKKPEKLSVTPLPNGFLLGYQF